MTEMKQILESEQAFVRWFRQYGTDSDVPLWLEKPKDEHEGSGTLLPLSECSPAEHEFFDQKYTWLETQIASLKKNFEERRLREAQPGRRFAMVVWSNPEFSNGADAAACNEELHRIADENAGGGGGVSRDEIIEAARNPDSPFHKVFTWDDREAAIAYRRMQFRTMMQNIIDRVAH